MCISTSVPQHRSGVAVVPVVPVVQAFQVVRSTCASRHRYFNIDRGVKKVRMVQVFQVVHSTCVSRRRYLNIDGGLWGLRWFRCFKWFIRHVHLDGGTSTSIGVCGGSGGSGVQVVHSTCASRRRYLNIDRGLWGFR